MLSVGWRRRTNMIKPDKIDEVANDLDDVKMTVEELEDDPPPTVDPKTIDALQQAIEDARDAADELVEQKD